MFAKFLLAALALPALLARADPEPSVPGPGDSFKQGGECIIIWEVDATGKWTDMKIELMTGDNLNMVPLKVITTIDATKEILFSHPCPKVFPNSAIYFYQFTSSSSTEKHWTTRFTITDENGDSTPPTETTQPNGAQIPWGKGTILEESVSEPGSSSGLSSLSPSSSPGLPGSSNSRSSSISSPSSSRLSSTRTPAPTQTGVNASSSQDGSNGDMAVAVPKALAFVICLVTVSTAFFL